MRTQRALFLPLMSAFGVSLLSATSLAQSASAASGEFSIQNFTPAPGTKNFLGVEGLRMDGNWGYSVGLFFNYARNPFTIMSCRSEGDCSSPNATNKTDVPVVSDMMTWDLLAAVSPLRRLQVGLRLPLTYVSGSGIDMSTGQPVAAGLKKFGVGDPMLEAKVRILGGAQDRFLLGAAADLSFPVGHAFSDSSKGNNFYLGNSSPITGGLRAILDARLGPVDLGLNLRGVFREKTKLGTTQVGPVDFRYGGAVGYRVSPIFRVLAEGTGSTQFSAQKGTNTLEVDAAVEILPLGSHLVIRVGGGAGVVGGVGVPKARAFLGVAWAQEVGDLDSDYIPDDADKCPTIAEDKDGFEDDDGCPDLDNDGDKRPDDKDMCPNMPEAINGFMDDDGCPDEVSDRDKDGIPDTTDVCPDAGGKEILRTGKHVGCPDPDHDNLPDHVDKCPTEPEDFDGFADEDGCPELDNDNDKILDEFDECVDQSETFNGFKDQDGCPDQAPGGGPSLVSVTDTEIKILDKIEFATNKDVIQGAKSFKILDVVATVLDARKDAVLVEVGGHTDNVGAAPANRKLAHKRAEAVIRYLVKKGIDGSRLVPKGYGPDKPIGDNNTPAGRQQNRRVEFQILKSTAKPAPAQPAPAQPAPAAPPPTQ